MYQKTIRKLSDFFQIIYISPIVWIIYKTCNNLFSYNEAACNINEKQVWTSKLVQASHHRKVSRLISNWLKTPNYNMYDFFSLIVSCIMRSLSECRALRTVPWEPAPCANQCPGTRLGLGGGICSGINSLSQLVTFTGLSPLSPLMYLWTYIIKPCYSMIQWWPNSMVGIENSSSHYNFGLIKKIIILSKK